MSNPTHDPAPESGAGPSFEAVFSALKQWRDGLVREGRLPLGGLKDTHLKTAIVRGRRDHRQIITMLPAAYGHVATDIVDVIMSVDPRTSPPVVAPPAARPPTQVPAAPVKPPTAPPARPPASQTPAPPTGQAPTGQAPAGQPAAAAADPMAPPPRGTVAPPVVRAARTDEQLAELRNQAQDFAALDFSEEIGQPGPLRTKAVAEEILLSWDRPTEPVGGSLYRVVSTDDHPGWAPEYGELIDLTTEVTNAADGREFVAAVRFYQVWRNSGNSWHEAVTSQPRLHAQTALVVPIQALIVREDGGRVIGQWSVFEGVNRVHVYRIPIARAGMAGQDPQFLIATEDANLSGFSDRPPEGGGDYLYRFYAEATIDGVAQLSAAVGKVVRISAVLSPVTDLQVHGHGDVDEWVFDLTWSNPPAGRVAIFRTENPPSVSLAEEAQPESGLQHGGLRPEDRLAHPTHAVAPGRTGMREVPSPRGWDRVYFTPVTLVDGRAMVGPSVAQVIIPVPEELVVVERTQYQMLKFGWPGDAAAVAIGLGHPQAPATTPQEGAHYWEISRDAYEQIGGFRFPQLLPALNGCSVHVAGISFVNRERVYGDPAVTQYPGLLQMSYGVELKRTLLGRPERLIIRMNAVTELNNCPPFVCVFNAGRLPLHHRDGELLPVSMNSDEAPEAKVQFHPMRLGPPPIEATFRVAIRGRLGYVRVFPDLPPEVLRRVALLDPPVGSLTVRG